MPKQIRQIRPQLEPLSAAALQVLHVLEPVVGRIIGTAVLKFACGKAGVDPDALRMEQIPLITEHIKTSLTFYDRSTEVADTLVGLAGGEGGGDK
jgi:hypothetical protein